MHVELAKRAIPDLRGLDPSIRRRIAAALERLDDPSTDVKALTKHAPWRRLRTGDYRIVFRPLTAAELATLNTNDTTGMLVERIVDRRDLTRAVASLT